MSGIVFYVNDIMELVSCLVLILFKGLQDQPDSSLTSVGDKSISVADKSRFALDQ